MFITDLAIGIALYLFPSYRTARVTDHQTPSNATLCRPPSHQHLKLKNP